MEADMILDAFAVTGKMLRSFVTRRPFTDGFDFTERIISRMARAEAANPWFTQRFLMKAMDVWGNTLTDQNLKRWAARYPRLHAGRRREGKNVALIMAGNIPLVGMHDLLCCLLAGHHAIAKHSSVDNLLLPLIGEMMIAAEPALKDRMTFTSDKVTGFDAVIATGSDNSARYFEYYFGRYPHIIRKNRNSAAVLDGSESFSNLDDLCDDIFDYFGLGCRNVSKIFVPRGYDFSNLTILFDAFDDVGNHHKYRNNYDYRKSIFIINRIPFIDHRNVLLVNDPSLHTPVAVLHYEEYDDPGQVSAFIAENRDRIQCLVCNNALADKTVPFGKTQTPCLWDYADGVDTMEFLINL